MTKPRSSVDMATEMLREFEGFERSGGKEAFKKQLREEFVRRSGAPSLDEALGKAMASLVCQTLQTGWPARKRVARSRKPRKPAGYPRKNERADRP